MKESSRNRGPLLFCLTSLLMYMVMPAVSLYVPAIVKVALVVAVVVLMSADSNKTSIIKIACKLIPVYIIALVKLLNVDTGYLLATIYDLLGTYVVSCAYLHLFIENKQQLSKKVMISVAVIYLITAVTTIMGNMIFPQASRLMSTGMDGEHTLYDAYRAYNIGSFAFVYELVLPVAFLPFVFKQKVLPRWLTIGIYVLVLYCMYASQFTIALVCVLGYGVFFFIGYIRNPRGLIGYAIVFGIILFAIVPVILPWLGSNVGDEIMSQRFEEMSNVVSGVGATEDSDVDQRQSLYMRSINTFLANPLTGGKGGGGHSFILDIMAKYGIMGILMLWIMLRSMYNIYVRPYRHTFFYSYLLFSYIIYLMLIILNPGPLYMSVTFLVPLIAFVLGNEYEKSIIGDYKK